MAQTSVEWLFEQIPEHLRLTQNGFDVFQQAKEMHKQEIIDAWENIGVENSEQYYKDTFKK